MLFLLLPLLAALFPGGDSEGGFEEPVSYHLLQTSSFHNHSWVHLGSGWLGELQTHSWNSSSGAFIFLYPWSRGNFSNRELVDLERFLRVNSIGIQEFYTNYFMSEDPFDLQIATGCELHSGKGFLGFKQVAIQGSVFMSFQNETWLPSQEGGRKAQKVCELLMKPEAWLSSGPSPGPGRLLLVCHVSGFYPKPMWVMWMRGGQEQQGTQRGDILPNADGTWYLQATLDVAAGEAAGLACRVKHSSLGGQDLVLYWGAPPSALGWILLAVIVALALLTGLGFWFRKRCCKGWNSNREVNGDPYIRAEMKRVIRMRKRRPSDIDSLSLHIREKRLENQSVRTIPLPSKGAVWWSSFCCSQVAVA
ncbi:T-cell surface glycoprotein CD1a-like [Urocitellus parryii]